MGTPDSKRFLSRGLPLYALFIADAVSLVGNVFSTIAIPWFVLQTTDSAVRTGISGFFTILPVVLAGFLGGAIVDRLGFKRTSIISDVASGLTTALIPALHFTIGLEFWQLMALVFLGALLDTPGSTARAALLPDLARQAGMDVERAAALSHVIERSARLVGAPLAGLFISLFSISAVLWLDALSFGFSALMISVFIQAPKAVEKSAAPGKYWSELRAGFQFIARDEVILVLVVMVMLLNFLDTIFGGVVLPVYVNQVFGSALNLGLLVGANGAGAVVGGLIYAAIGKRFPRYPVFVAAFILTGLRFWVYALQPPLLALLAGVFISSLGAGPLNPIISAVEYERIPVPLRGRVFGAIRAGAWVAMPLGMLLGGVLTDRLGVMPNLIGLGVVYPLVTLGMSALPALRQISMRRDPQAAD